MAERLLEPLRIQEGSAHIFRAEENREQETFLETKKKVIVRQIIFGRKFSDFRRFFRLRGHVQMTSA